MIKKKQATQRTTSEVTHWIGQLYKITGGGGGLRLFKGPYLALDFCSCSKHLVSCSNSHMLFLQCWLVLYVKGRTLVCANRRF